MAKHRQPKRRPGDRLAARMPTGSTHGSHTGSGDEDSERQGKLGLRTICMVEDALGVEIINVPVIDMEFA